MNPSDTRPQAARYIVHSDHPSSLEQILDGIRDDPAIELEQTIGPTEAPHTAVLRMNEAQARGLRHRFGSLSGVSIEPDQPLLPFQ